MLYTNRFDSPLGGILLAADDEGLTGLWFTEDQRDAGRGLFPDAVERDAQVFSDARRWLDIYFSGRDPGFTPRLNLTGSPFRVRVMELLMEIPFGATAAYGDLARRIADEKGAGRMSAQAVGGAVGANPISLIVPCHRVVGANGCLTGYGGGLWRKEALLKLEGGWQDRFFQPKHK